MRLFARAKPEPVPERRASPRTRVDCPATMHMPSGDRLGRLSDISAVGARFLTDKPPAPGTSGILDWSIHEAFCHVTWSKPGMCGVEFDRPLTPKALRDSIETAAVGPRAVPPPSPGSAPVRGNNLGKRGKPPGPRLFC